MGRTANETPGLAHPHRSGAGSVAQDTAVGAEYPMWPMSGVRWTVHLAPFHRSASVRAPLAEEPAATQTVGEGQDTPVNRLAWVGLGPG